MTFIQNTAAKFLWTPFYKYEVCQILDSRLSEEVFGSYVIGILSFPLGNKWSKKSLIKATKSNGEAKGPIN